MSDTAIPADELQLRLEQHRGELTGYCYRMLGSAFDADDAVQETMVRAWRSYDRFEGRAALRSWLHRIATNVCLDTLHGRKRRGRPVSLGPGGLPEVPPGPARPDAEWVLPIPDARVIPADADASEQLVARETIRLAFVAALQRLPARQRAVLILREVLSWSAEETAALLDTTVASVNSALQRARATLAGDVAPTDVWSPLAEGQQALLTRYVDAFERYDVASLTSLLHEDATLSMPPFEMWLTGHDVIAAWLVGPGAGCRGSRLVPVLANGTPAFGQYRPRPEGGFAAWALQVLEIHDGRIVAMNTFLDTPALFPLFGLPPTLG